MASDDWDDRKFNKWQKLRENFRVAKKEKDYNKLISIGNSILELDTNAKFIGIFVPLFQKEMADAYLNLNQNDKAIEYYQAALTGYKADREKRKTTAPDSWVKDISRLEKKLGKLLS